MVKSGLSGTGGHRRDVASGEGGDPVTIQSAGVLMEVLASRSTERAQDLACRSGKSFSRHPVSGACHKFRDVADRQAGEREEGGLWARRGRRGPAGLGNIRGEGELSTQGSGLVTGWQWDLYGIGNLVSRGQVFRRCWWK